MESERRWGGRKVVVLAVIALLVALGVLAGSCAARGGADDDAPPATADESSGPSEAALAGLEPAAPEAEPTASTTGSTRPPGSTAPERAPAGAGPSGADPGEGEPGGSGPGGSGGAGGGGAKPEPIDRLPSADCGALQRIAIPAAAIITAADFTPVEQRVPPSPVDGEAELAAARRVAAIAPSGARPAWGRAVVVMERAAADQRPLTEAERDVLLSARNAVEVWARAACPDAPPSWRCDHFGSISGPDVAPTKAEAPTADEVLRRVPDSGSFVVLQRADGIVLYGRVDASGFVQRTVQIEQVDGGWATARRHICHGA